MTSSAAKPTAKSSIRETLMSIVIAFAMAFVFRGFVIEAFLIPTGSMAPTLLGAHLRWQGKSTGYSWPTDTRDRVGAEPYPVQGTRSPLEVHDPMSGQLETASNVPTRWGDRIFVMKYLYSVYEPQRWDVVVFKNPTDPTQNYIKRLLGLPGEQLAIVDGDVFTRTPTPGDAGNPWRLPGWSVARKPDRAQRAMWQEVFSSTYAPQNASTFRSPWRAAPGSDPALWSIGSREDYAYTGSGQTALAWDASVRRLEDIYPYNQFTVNADPELPRYPVSDLRLSLGVRPEKPGLAVAAVIATRGHEFRAEIEGTAVRLRMKRYGGPRRDPDSPAVLNDPPGDWIDLATATLPGPLPAGTVTNLDFWHVDQRLTLFVNDAEVAHGDYTWSPAERIANACAMTPEQVVELGQASLIGAAYTKPEVRWEFSGGPFSLYRVALARDIHYRADIYRQDAAFLKSRSEIRAARATHPTNTPALTPDQYFMCGDNSASSADGRLWDRVSPWVAAEVDDAEIGVVHRDLIIGKAFWVYFPAPTRRHGIPIPDFGRMRFIW